MDIRKLVFEQAELLQAFEAYGRTHPSFLPSGKLISCLPREPGTVVMTVEMHYGGTQQEAEFLYHGVDILRPLIMFCIEGNVILPRAGRKSFKIEGGRIILLVELDLNMDAKNLTAIMQGEHIKLIKSDGRA